MLYCENCMMLVEGAKCPTCKNKELREIQPADPILLLTKEAMWAEMAEDVLRQNGISVLKRGVLGAGLATKLGAGLESFRLYVSWEKLEDARELMAGLFPADYGILLPEDEAEESQQ